MCNSKPLNYQRATTMYPGGAWLKDSTIQPNSVGLFGFKNIHPDLLLSWMIKKTLYITLSLCPSGCLENTQNIHPVSSS